MAESGKRPFWAHQGAEYLIGIVFVAQGRQSTTPMVPTLVGGYATVANYLDRLHDEAKLEACMFAFPDFEHDIDLFQQHIHPRLASRKGRMGGPR